MTALSRSSAMMHLKFHQLKGFQITLSKLQTHNKRMISELRIRYKLWRCRERRKDSHFGSNWEVHLLFWTVFWWRIYYSLDMFDSPFYSLKLISTCLHVLFTIIMLRIHWRYLKIRSLFLAWWSKWCLWALLLRL